MSVTTVNPSNGRPLRVHREFTRAEVESVLGRSKSASRKWSARPIARRSHALRSVARVLLSKKAALARLAAEEMGKPLAQGIAEVEKCAKVCLFYAQHGPAFLADERPPGAPAWARVVYQPLGTVLAIMPWNFPFWQAFRAAAPALMAGNAMLLKHAANVSGCAKAIADVFDSAGIPRGVFQILVIPTSRIKAVLQDPRVSAVTLTGSTEAGKIVAAQAGAVMKKGVFELGGSDPYLVLKDADIAHAAEICASSRLNNAGQTCIAAKRFIVVRPVLKRFEQEFTQRMAARKVGSPLDPTVDVGPLARADLRATLHRQVSKSAKKGARILLGGRAINGPGFFYAPTVLTDVRKGMPAYEEELFGPVAAIIPVRDEEEAIAVANDSRFGLGAAVFTRSKATAERVAARLESGNVFANDLVKSDPSLPFGGIKESGYGRELGPVGIREFVNAKTLMIR
jgi:succinate-semialdehyde dehydrogenase / glutarate-semialdehyde dehydrogenase